MADFKNTKEGRNVAHKYADILHLGRPEPPVKHPRMALSNRAKIFSPFAALRGFDDEISSEGASKLLVKKVELSDEEKNNLSDKLLQVKKGMKVRMMASGAEYEIIECGHLLPLGMEPCQELIAGEVGYLTASIKNVKDTRVGDTVTGA